MPPKRRGRSAKASSSDQGEDMLASMAAGPSTPAKRAAPGRKGRGKAASNPLVPDVYRDMLAEALPAQVDVPDRPLKRRRTGKRPGGMESEKGSSPQASNTVAEDLEENDLVFEDVVVPVEEEASPSEGEDDDEEFSFPPKLQQTAYRSDHSDDDFEDDIYDFDVDPDHDEPSGDLELTLTKKAPELTTPSWRKRRVITKDDKAIRLQTHKMHLLCLLSYLDKRNDWINDMHAKETLRKLLDKKMVADLRPPASATQFNHGEWLKRGLGLACNMWNNKFKVTNTGMRRALWAEDDKDLENYATPENTDTVFDVSDFREAGQKLSGSRDLGAQLFCSMLRSVGVEARLVCSLQPLSFNPGGPSMARAPPKLSEPKTPEREAESPQITYSTNFKFATPNTGNSSVLPLNPRQRLGHPNAAGYHVPDMSHSFRTPSKPKPQSRPPIIESTYPVFWVEVFDSAHQKWLPVDPVTESVAKPRNFEPPANDTKNTMAYIIAFEEEGCARDVTRRYTKAYNAKTRRNRVECTPGGQRWWTRALRPYARGYSNDADQIEDAEFAAAEAKEPMPKNIQDFKDHPYYALERHLKRNEILISTREIGKVAAGKDANAPGGKRLESIYRRSAVKVARSYDAWYRLGRDVKNGEQPIRIVPAKRRPGDVDMDGEDDMPGTGLYTEDQTELFRNPPVVNGLVPKNRFGNIEIFIPTMMPEGGVHLPYPEAVHAAKIVGVDFSEALTGWEFRGRNGTPVIKGIVVATEYKEAVEAVVQGLRDEQERAEEGRRSLAVERMWRRLLMGLRIKQRIDTYAVEGEEADPVPEPQMDAASESDVSEYKEDEGGGFFPE